MSMTETGMTLNPPSELPPEFILSFERIRELARRNRAEYHQQMSARRNRHTIGHSRRERKQIYNPSDRD